MTLSEGKRKKEGEGVQKIDRNKERFYKRKRQRERELMDKG